MIILAIDPGPKESAWVLFDGKMICAHNYVDNEIIVDSLSDRCFPVDNNSHAIPYDVLVIEWIEGYGLTVGRETFDTCRWVGRFEQAAGGCHLVGRKAVKSHLCCTTQAKDKDVRQAVMDKLGEPGTKKAPGPTYGIVGDEWSALALAIYWAETQAR